MFEIYVLIMCNIFCVFDVFACEIDNFPLYFLYNVQIEGNGFQPFVCENWKLTFTLKIVSKFKSVSTTKT